MKNFPLKVAVVLALAASILAWAQADSLINGMEGDNVRRILVDSAGRLRTNESHGSCTNTTTTISTTAAACPATPRSDRSSILIQLIQAGETLRITADGTDASATNGIQLSSGGSYDDDLLGTVSTNCRCSASSCQVLTVECP